MFKYTLGFLLILCTFQAAMSQERGGGEPPFTTPNTHTNPNPDPKGDRPKRREIKYIIKKDTKGFLPGNKCYEEVTRGMGFQYLAVPKGQAYYETEFDRNLHNLGAKIIILLRNGIFWKIKVNKAYKKCKYGYRDLNG